MFINSMEYNDSQPEGIRRACWGLGENNIGNCGSYKNDSYKVT